MTLARPTIVAIGGGGCGIEPENHALDEYLHSLTGKERPSICFVPTASGDNDAYIVRFHGAFTTERWAPSHLRLFMRTARDLREVILSQDVVYVGGGNTAAALAIWRQHGLDTVLREAWERGILLCGPSAGGNCWFEACSTDSFGLDLDPLNDGLGFLPGSFCPHYDGEVRRRPTLRDFVTSDRLPAGWAADNYVALRFEGEAFTEAVTSKPGAQGYQVSKGADGGFEEQALEMRAL
jgi:dipeptidase E